MAPTTTKTAAPKAKTTAGVKKKAGKKGKASLAMVQMQAFFKENRPNYKELSFGDQQKELGKLWKASPKNPKHVKNSA